MSEASRTPAAESTVRRPRLHRANKLPLAVALLVLGLGLVAATLWLAGDDSWRKVQSSRTVRVGYAIEAPYAFVDAAGRVTGEGPEIAREIAKRLGLGEPDWVLTDFGDLIPELEAGRFDAIAAGLFVTEERRRRVAFSRPTARVGAGLLVARGNPHRLHAYGDATLRPNIKIAALRGSVEEGLLVAAGLPEPQLMLVPDAITGLELLRSGVVAGLALSAPTVRWMAAESGSNSRVEVAIPFTDLSPENTVAFAFRPADRALRRKWDAALASFMREDAYASLERSFGFPPIIAQEPRS